MEGCYLIKRVCVCCTCGLFSTAKADRINSSLKSIVAPVVVVVVDVVVVVLMVVGIGGRREKRAHVK